MRTVIIKRKSDDMSEFMDKTKHGTETVPDEAVILITGQVAYLYNTDGELIVLLSGPIFDGEEQTTYIFSSCELFGRDIGQIRSTYLSLFNIGYSFEVYDAPFLNTANFKFDKDMFASPAAETGLVIESLTAYRDSIIKRMFSYVWPAYEKRLKPWDNKRKEARKKLIAEKKARDEHIGRKRGTKSLSKHKLDGLELILDWWPEEKEKAIDVYEKNDIPKNTFFRWRRELINEFNANPEEGVEAFKARKRQEIAIRRNDLARKKR